MAWKLKLYLDSIMAESGVEGPVVDASTPKLPCLLPVGMELEDVEREVSILLAGVESIEEFQEIYTVIGLAVPTLEQGVVDTPKRYYKALVRHLLSDEVENSDDKGQQIFLKIYDRLTGGDEDTKTDVRVEGKPNDTAQPNVVQTVKNLSSSSQVSKLNSSVNSNGGARRKPLFDVQKLKEFKLDGTIGGSGAPGGKEKRLTYSSLEYQIMNALAQGYGEDVVCLAVVKAISPDNELRAYFEGRKSLNVDTILESLRGHFEESESATVLADLGKAKQKSSQTAHSFLVSVFVLRDRVLKLAEEEGSPQDERFVYNRMKHAIETGVRNQNIRGELREVLSKNRHVSDDVLLKIAKEAMAREKARLAKFGPQEPESDDVEEAEVAAIHARPPTPPNKTKACKTKPVAKKEPNFQTQVNELKASQELLQASVLELTTAFKDMRKETASARNFQPNVNPPAPQNPPRYPPNNQNPNRNRASRTSKGRCHACVNSGVRCPHCFLCGGLNHQMHECEKNC